MHVILSLLCVHMVIITNVCKYNMYMCVVYYLKFDAKICSNSTCGLQLCLFLIVWSDATTYGSQTRGFTYSEDPIGVRTV